MRINRITVENGLYALAILLALGVRFTQLSVAPLSDAEASWALQALNVAHGQHIALGSQPAYVFLTGIFFWVLGSSNALARFWPALTGTALALAPFFFRRYTGRKAALILTFGLALDPGLVALSRQAGGPMLALGFGILALGLTLECLPVWAGIFAGLALLSGPAILPGLLGLGLAWGGARLLERIGFLGPLQEADNLGATAPAPLKYLRWEILSMLATLLVMGSLFLRFPQGLSAWVGTLPAYLSGWTSSSGVPALRLLGALTVYQPLGLIFGLVGIWRVWFGGSWGYKGRSLSLRLSLWVVIALILAFLYPGRQVGDLGWVLLPLWGLAAIELADQFTNEAEQWVVSFGQAALIFVLLALFWLNLAGMSQSVLDAQLAALRIGVLVGVLALGILTTVLVGLGWSWEVARQGLVWGACVALGVYVLAGMWGVSLLRSGGRLVLRQEFWNPTPITGEADLLLSTLGDLSEWKTGLRKSIDVTVEVDTPSLRWALRNYPNAKFVSGPMPGESPSVIITRKDQAQPSQSVAYRGQDFGWWIVPGWSGALPPDFLYWLAFRQAPMQNEQIILWARDDLFPGGSLQPAGQITPADTGGQSGGRQ